MQAKSLSGWLMILPALVIVVVFGLYPVLSLVLNSLGVGQVGIFEDAGFTFAHYVEAFSTGAIQRSILNSIFVAIGAVFLAVVLSIPVVLYLAKRAKDDRRGRSTAGMDGLLTFPIVLPGIIIGFFSIILIGRNGLFAQVFPPLSGMAFTYIGLFVAYIFFSIPRVVGPLRGAAELLDRDLLEVARSLGASQWRVFTSITLPLILPAAIEVSGTAAAVALGGYGTVAALSEGIRLLPLDVVDALNNGFNIVTSSAYAVILALLTILCLVLGRVVSAAVRSGSAKRGLR